MKYWTFLLVMLSGQLFSQSLPLEKVEVYFEGARFTHSGSIKLSEGANEVQITGVSPKLLESSIAIQFGSEEVHIQQLEVKTRKAEAIPRIIEIRDSLKVMKGELSLTHKEVEILNKEKQLAFESLSRQGQSSMSDPAAAQNMLDFYRDRLIDIEQKVMDLISQIEVEKESVNEIADRLAQREKVTFPHETILVLTIDSQVEEEVKLDLFYETNGAGWAPEYIIEADLETNQVGLLYKVGIFNETGIDWEGVDCLVSTAQLGMDRARPTLQKWTVKSFRDWKNKHAESFDNTVQSSNYQFKAIQVEEKMQDFPLERKIDLVADGKVEWFNLKQLSFDAEFRNFAVPKVNSTVYVEGGFTGWESMDLIPAEAKIYSGTKYIGETFLNPYIFNDTMWVAFGSNPQMNVKRNRLEVDKSRSFLGRRIKEKFTFEISVRNNSSMPTAITIKDQVPVSEDEKITVEIGDLSSASVEEATGILTWNLKMEAQASQEIQFSYIIEYPKGMSYSQVRRKFRTISAPSF